MCVKVTWCCTSLLPRQFSLEGEPIWKVPALMVFQVPGMQPPPRQAPPTTPLVQVVPSVLLDVPQLPPLQVGTLHELLVLQVWQLAPLLPQ